MSRVNLFNQLIEDFNESSLQEFIDSLKLNYKGDFINDRYVIKLNTSNEFSELYNKLSNNKELQVLDNPIADNDSAVFIFSNGEFEAKISRNFNKDFYRLEVSRI